MMMTGLDGSTPPGELLSSNSVRSSIVISDADLEGLDHHEASVSGAEMCNQRPSNTEKAENPNENENRKGKTKYM